MSAKLTLFEGSSRTTAFEPASSISRFVHAKPVGRHRHQLLAQHRSRLVHGARGHRAGTAALGARAIRRHRGVALDGRDVFDVGAERVGGQLHHRRLDAVAGRPAVHVDVDLARRLHPDGRAFGGEVPRCRAGRFDVRREAEADVATLFQRFALFAAEALMVEDLDRLLEGVRGRDVVVGHAVGVEVRHLVAAEDIAAAQVDGVHVHLACGDVEKDFAREGFVLPRTAVGGKPRGVGEHRLVVEARLRHAIRPREEHADGGGGQHRVRRRIGADVIHEVDIGGEDVAFVVERHPRPAVDMARLARGHQVLAPVLDPLERERHLARGQQDAHVFAHRDDLLAEAAAGVAHDDAHAVRRDAQQPSRERTQFVRCLGGRPYRQFLRRRLPTRPPCRASPSAPAHRSVGRRSLLRRVRRTRTSPRPAARLPFRRPRCRGTPRERRRQN